MKRCSKCHVEKPLSEFTRDKNKPTGYKYACKVCDVLCYPRDPAKHTIYMRRWRAEHREHYASYQKCYHATYVPKR